jgi:hypothetical protein
MDCIRVTFYISSMPTIELSPGELRTLAMALRIAARQADQDTSNQGNPRIKESFATDARSFATLAEKIDAARKRCP